ncbi:carboxypeptidase regulatory-like domain-containing protein [Schlesneria paludicola]|uniref:carboxypeptidase regulatory-like domain-containing protein n=1 Tax=Schlesneria paludicola TaxID=360056 RepID=UPI00029A4D17|nr:carboxypeptidase regulatory-like domain-containing protein [Schlesneria paludicola]
MVGYQAAGLFLVLLFSYEDGKEAAEGPDQSQSQVAQQEPGKRLFGTVYDEVTQRPIPLAKLCNQRGQIVRSDKHGRFQFQTVASDFERIIVTSMGRATRLINVDLSERPSAEVDIFLSPGATVHGRVVDQEGRPVPNARIERIGTGSQLLNFLTAITDAEGRFEFDDFPTNRLMLPLRVTASGYEERNGDLFATGAVDQPTELTLRVVKVEQEEGEPQLKVRLGAGDQDPEVGVVRGRVVDPQGKPVRNFTVEFLLPSILEPADWGSFPSGGGKRSYTHDDGRFLVGHLEATKRYRVAVVVPGFGRADVEPIYAEVAARQNEFEFRLTEPYQLVVKVVDQANQQPLSDVMVGLSGRHFNQGDFEWDFRLHDAQILRTTEAGLATFDKLPMKAARLIVQKPGYARQQHAWVDNGKTVEIQLVSEASVRVKLKLATSRVISGLNLKLRTENGDVRYGCAMDNAPSPTIHLDQLSPGACALEVYDGFAKEPWNAVLTRPLELKAGDNVFELDLP